MPTISGAACAGMVMRAPAPMVAATATAILIDIDFLSAFASSGPQWGPSNLRNVSQNAVADTFLSACVNRMVSTRRCRTLQTGERKGKVAIKVNDLETTLAGKLPR